jgi:hypothetical protein
MVAGTAERAQLDLQDGGGGEAEDDMDEGGEDLGMMWTEVRSWDLKSPSPHSVTLPLEQGSPISEPFPSSSTNSGPNV